MSTSKILSYDDQERFTNIFFSSKFGIFNVSVLAKNRVTETATFDDVMSIVTEARKLCYRISIYLISSFQAPCSPPKLSIPFNSTQPLSAPEYFRSEKVVISANAVLNCTPVITTK